MNVFPRKRTPKQDPDDIRNSVDVVTLSEDGLLNIGYYSFYDEKWNFHTDTIVDMTETDFVWMYAPDELLHYFENLKTKP